MYNLIDNPDHALAIIDTLKKSSWALAIDFETSGVNTRSCEVYLMSICDSKNTFVFDMLKIDLGVFKELLESRWLIAQNAVFELVILKRWDIHPRKVYDTYLAECVIQCGTSKRKDLKSIAKRYLKIDIDKSVVKNITRKNYTSVKVVQYSAIDVIHLFRIHYKQIKKLRALNALKTYLFELEYLRVMVHTTYNGIKLHKEKWNELNANIIQEKDQALDKLNSLAIEAAPELQESLLFGLDINWNSPSQVKSLFQKHVHKDLSGVGAKEIIKYKNNPLVKQFLDYTKLCKKISSFGDTYIEAIDKTTQRLHPSYTQIVKTGRVSCKEPNIQNIPKQDAFRKCFIAEPGNVLVVGDYSSQESRILADKSQSPELMEFFKSGGSDLHSFVALKAFSEEIGNIPIEDVKDKFPKLREKAKQANFALVYGGNGTTVARNLDIPEEEGLAVEKAFFDAFPSVKEFFTLNKKQSIRKGYIVTDSFIERKIFSDNIDLIHKQVNTMNTEEKKKFFTAKSEFERLAMNYPIQGTAATMTKLAGIYLLFAIKNIPEVPFNIILFVHDEILLECAQEHAPRVQHFLKYAMEKAASVLCPSVPIPVDPVITPYWTH